MSNKSNTQPHSAPYRAALANWSTSKLGEKPTEAAFSVLHALGLRPGSKHSLAMALYMRTAGATDAQVRQAAHKMTPDVAHQGSLFNYMRDYVKVYKLFDRDMTVAKGVYKITLNARGQADVDRKAKAQADAAPVKAPVKKAAAKKPRAAKAAAAPVADASVLIPAAPVADTTAPVADAS